MTVYLPRRFVLVAVSAAVLALVAGLLLLSGSEGDSPVAALTAGTASTLARAGLDPAPTVTRRGLLTTTTGAPTTTPTVAPTTEPTAPPVTEPAPPATAADPPATATARRSPATTAATIPPATAPAIVAVPTTMPPPVTTTAPLVAGSDSGLAAAVVAAHNRERAARGLPALQRSTCLDGIATAWAAHLATIGRLAHNPGSAAATEACLLWEAVGENLGYDGTIDDLEQAWMDSAEHEANILDPDFTQVGVGVVRRNGLLYVVVNFAG